MNIDYIIVSFYLVITLAIGFWKGSGLKNLRDYAVANVNYSTFAIVATLCATLMGAGTTFGIAEKVYKYGLVYVLVVGGATINQIFIGQYIVPKIKNFKNFISVGEIMKSFYGRDIQVITGVCAALISLGFVSTQISAIGYIINHFLGINYFYGVLIGYGLVIMYSAFGGMRSVVATDILQFGILIIAIPIICSIGINQIGGFKAFASAIPASSLDFDFFRSDHINEFMIFLLVGIASPSFIQRILIAKNIQQAKRAITINGIISFPFYLVVGIIGLIALELSPDINANMALPYLIQNILPIGIKGLVIAGLLSVLMSSADSEINVAGVSLVNDVVKTIFNLKLSDRQEILWSRTMTTILGLGTIAVAMHFSNIIDIMFYAFTFWGPTILVPLVFSLYGFKVNRLVFYAGFLTSILSVTIFSGLIKDNLGVDPIVSSIAITTIFYALYFILTSKKSRLNLLKNFLVSITKVTFNLSPIVNRVKNYILYNTKQKILSNSISKSYYEYFGIFCFLFYLIPYFLWAHSDKNYFGIIILRIIACCLSLGLIMQESWSKFFKKYLPMYWSASLIYCLPFLSTYMLLHNNVQLPWVMNSIIAMFILVLLVDRFSFFFILLTGVVLALVSFCLTSSFFNSNIDNYDVFFGAIMFVFSLIIGIILLSKREQAANLIIQKNNSLKKLNRNLEDLVSERTSHLVKAISAKQEFLNNMSHEIRTPVHGILNISKGLNENWKQFNEGEKKNFIKILANSSDRLTHLVNNVLDFSKIQSGQMEYHYKKSPIKSMLDELIKDTYNFANLHNKKINIQINKFKNINFNCDEEKLKIALLNILTNAVKYGHDEIEVEVSVGKKLSISIRDNGIGIPQKELNKIFEPFVESSLTKTRAGGKGLGLALCKEIIKAHNGEVSAKNVSGRKGSEFSIKLPLN